MKEKLPKDVYHKLVSTIETGKKLDQEIAEHCRQCDQRMGPRPRRHSFLSLVPAADRDNC